MPSRNLRDQLRVWIRELTPPLVARLLRRLVPRKPQEARPQGWIRVAAGPLQGRRLLLAPTDDPGAWQARMAGGTFDDEIFRFLAPLRTEGAVFFDVGAHVGYHSLAFAALGGPAARVLAFEPNSSNLARLRANLDENADLAARVVVSERALSDSDGSTLLFTNQDVDGGGSSMGFLEGATPPAREAVYKGAGFRPHPVSTARLDTLVGNGTIPAPDFVKVDVEGAEHLVLQGGLVLLRDKRPVLLLEVHNALSMLRVLNVLQDLRYAVELLHAERDGRSHVAAKPRDS